MTANGSRLPPGFESLDPFVDHWALTGTAAREALRGSSSEAERKAFYEAAVDLLAPALAYLDTKPLETFDEREKRLMNLMLSLASASIAVEVQGPDEAKHHLVRQHMKITRSTADFGA